MQSSNPLVSVIIPTYNAAGTIMRTIESVLAQTYANIEIIVVDDGSTDETKQVVESLIRDKKVHYIRQDNQGCGVARNHGARFAKGQYLAFLDSDDYFHKEKIQRQIESVMQHPAWVVSYTDAYEIDPLQKMIWDVRQTGAGKLRKGRVLSYLAFRNFVTLSSVIVKRSAFEKVGGFEESYGLMMMADYDLWLKLAPLGDFLPLETPLAFYQTRARINRRQKRDNHRIVMTVFSNRIKSAGIAEMPWYVLGYLISFGKFSAHAALLAFNV